MRMAVLQQGRKKRILAALLSSYDTWCSYFLQYPPRRKVSLMSGYNIQYIQHLSQHTRRQNWYIYGNTTPPKTTKQYFLPCALILRSIQQARKEMTPKIENAVRDGWGPTLQTTRRQPVTIIYDGQNPNNAVLLAANKPATRRRDRH